MNYCGTVPKNADRNNKWAVKTFESWRLERSKKFPVDKQCPSDSLASSDCEAIAYWLSQFAAEVRKIDGLE